MLLVGFSCFLTCSALPHTAGPLELILITPVYSGKLAAVFALLEYLRCHPKLAGTLSWSSDHV